MTEILWWHWIVLGIFLMLAELAIPAFFLLWFGAAAVVVGAVVAVLPTFPFSFQVIAWTVGSVVLIWFWFKVFKRGVYRTRAGLSRGTFVGEIGLVIRELRPYDKGQIRFQKPMLGGETWEAIAEEEIPVGERVKVLDVEGNLLKVAKIQGRGP